MKIDKKIKVNLGCGEDYLEGWVNVDIEGSYKVDVTADLTKKFPFQNDSIDEIKASDILEHFTKEEGERFLKECFRILKRNGIITIRTHNIFQIYKQFHGDPEVLVHFLYGNTQTTGVFGAHKFAYTNDSLKIVLTLMGFKIVTFQNEQTNFLITAKKDMIILPKLNIGIIQQTPDIGGAETYMKLLVSEFLKNDHSVIIASNNRRFLQLFDTFSLKTYKIPVILDVIGNYRGLIKSTLFLPWAIVYYAQLLQEYKKQNVSVILMSGFSEKMLVSFLSVFFKIPVVWIEYGPLNTIFPRNFYLPKVLYRLLNKIPKVVIIPSNNTMQSMIVDARVSFSKLMLIQDGIEIPKLNIQKQMIALNNLSNKFIIGNVSRLTRVKGQQFLIKAMPEIIKKIPNAHLLLIGDGPDKSFYTDLVATLKLEKYITMTGFVDNLPQYYMIMDIFVFPTIWDLEGFGLVGPEAMSYKIPVIGSNRKPVSEIIKHGKTGILVDVTNQKALIHDIVDLFKDTKKRKELGENGYKEVKENYNIVTVGKKFIKVFNKVYFSTLSK